MPNITTTTFDVIFAAQPEAWAFDIPDLDTAMRLWTVAAAAVPGLTGGIRYETFRRGKSIRTGWVLHVTQDGAAEFSDIKERENT